MHGDVIVTTDAAGTRQGGAAQYDPFGQLIDPATWNIGTTAANDASPNNTTTPNVPPEEYEQTYYAETNGQSTGDAANKTAA